MRIINIDLLHHATLSAKAMSCMNKHNAWITFLPLWTAANLISWVLCSMIILPVYKPVGTLFVMPLMLSILQYIILRKFIEISSGWIWASYLVYGAFNLLFLFLSYDLASEWLLPIEIVTFFGLGFVQKKVLEFYTNRTIFWPVFSAAAAICATEFFLITKNVLFPNGTIVTFWIIFGLIYGISTGVTLVWMERSSTDETST